MGGGGDMHAQLSYPSPKMNEFAKTFSYGPKYVV